MPKSYQAKKAKLLKSGKLFKDKDFPAKQSSIFYKQDGSWRTDVEWKRPHVSLYISSTRRNRKFENPKISCSMMFLNHIKSQLHKPFLKQYN